MLVLLVTFPVQCGIQCRWWHWKIQGFLDLCPVPLTEWFSTSFLLGILSEALLHQLTRQPRSTGRNLRRILASFLASLTLLSIQVISKCILMRMWLRWWLTSDDLRRLPHLASPQRQHWSTWRRIHHQFYHLLPASQVARIAQNCFTRLPNW